MFPDFGDTLYYTKHITGLFVHLFIIYSSQANQQYWNSNSRSAFLIIIIKIYK